MALKNIKTEYFLSPKTPEPAQMCQHCYVETFLTMYVTLSFVREHLDFDYTRIFHRNFSSVYIEIDIFMQVTSISDRE